MPPIVPTLRRLCHTTGSRAARCALAVLGLAIMVGVFAAPARAARFPLDAPPLQATYLSQRIFMLPYQLNASDPLASEVDKVRLLMSRGASGEWTTLQEAEANVRGFSYHCPAEGEYYFAVQMVDRRGNAWPMGEIAPQLRLVVDTQKPQLKLEAKTDSRGDVLIRYAARDANLQADSLKIALQADDGAWQTADIPAADVTQPDRLIGRFQWQAPKGAAQLRLRATISDAAKLQAVATAEVNAAELNSPQELETGPNLGSPHASNAAPRNIDSNNAATGSQQAGSRPSQEWPALNQPRRHEPLPVVRVPANDANQELASERRPFENQFSKAPAQPQTEKATTTTPPFRNPYANSNSTNPLRRTPAQFAADGSQRSIIRPVSPIDAPPTTNAYATDGVAPTPGSEHYPSQDNPWQAASPAGRAFGNGVEPMLVNSRTFDLEYDLQTVGRWGVAKVEIYGTRDGGQTWSSYAVDTDNRSPIRVTVPGGGTFGLKILVSGANGAASPPPQPGEPPELIVQVDLHPPTTELVAAELGHGALADNLLIQWAAADTNLEQRPIGLYYSAYADGPWSTIATGIENTGQYAWRIERHVPERFYLKIEARDTAGNVTAAQTPTPVALNRPQPAARLRGVRSINDSRERVPTVRPFAPPPRPRNQIQPANQMQPADQTAMERGRGQR